MFLNKNYYLYSLLFHTLILLFFIYLIEIKKTKTPYTQKININLQYFEPIDDKKIKDKLPQSNKMNKKKTSLIQKENLNRKIESKEKVNKKNISQYLVPKKNKLQEIEDNNSIIELKEKNKVENELASVTRDIKKNMNSKNRSKEKKLNINKTAKPKSNTIDIEETKVFKKYNDDLKYIIQKKATENYPRVSIRKKEQGNVNLAFSIDDNGNIENIKIGDKTNASERLINSSIKTLKLISPYKKNNILKKKNTFSIIIVYKLE